VITLYKHQSDAIAFAIKNGGKIALFHEPGLGKTLTALEIFKHYRQQDSGLRMLVVCPLSLINAAWGEDTKKFTSFKYLPYSEVKNVGRGRPGCILDADVVGINYESLIVKSRFKEIHGLLAAGSWMLVVDESSRMKNPKSMTTKALLQLAPWAKHRVIASGTPAPNVETEFWAQAKFIQPDCYSDSFYAFRNNYFYLGRNGQVLEMRGRVMTRGMMAEVFQKGWKYQITDASRAELIDRMSPFTHWMKAKDALDLPDTVDEVRLIRLNPNERRAYNEMKRHLVAEIKTGRVVGGQEVVAQVTAEVALAKLMKLRQLTSGFAYDEKHDAHRPGRSSKMRELGDALEELGTQQVIIWVQFHEEVDAITKMLAEDGKTYTTLYQGTPDRDVSIKDFQEGRAQYLVAHPRSAAHGLTFVNAWSHVFFSLDYSYEAHEQARKRTDRIGQTMKGLYIYLVAENSIDGMCLDVLRRKKSLQDVYYELVQGEEL